MIFYALRKLLDSTHRFMQLEDEIIITRDSKPVARLTRVTPPGTKPRRWNPEAHREWIRKVFGNKVFPSSDAWLAAARADRKLTPAR